MNIRPPRKRKLHSIETRDEIAMKKNELYLRALRQREDDVVKFLGLLVPALVGYIWLLTKSSEVCEQTLFSGTVGVIFVLSVGAVFTVALGFNYRYITLQMAKIDVFYSVDKLVLKKWPRKPGDFKMIFCSPPEILKIYWISYLILILLICCISCLFIDKCSYLCIIFVISFIALLFSILLPFYYGCKIQKICELEGINWNYI